MKRLMLLTITTVGMLLAQGGPPAPPNGMEPGGGPRLEALQTALNITEQQAQDLTAFVREQRQSARENMKTVADQLRENRQQLHELLTAGGADPAAVGILVIQGQTLRDQIKGSRAAVHEAITNYVTNTLNRATELAALQSAADQMPAVQAATRLGLLTPPEGGARMRPMRRGGPRNGMGPAGFGHRGPMPQN